MPREYLQAAGGRKC